MAESKRDFYEVLGIEKSASDDDIKRAYRQAAKKYHPDLHPGDAGAEAKFKEVNEAYEVLSDKEKRARYDQFGHAGVDPNFGAGGGGGFGGYDFGDFGDLGDLFGSFFGGGFGAQSGRSSNNANAPRRGSDVRQTIVLSFEEAAKGCSKEIEYRRIEQCSDCHGSGARAGTTPKTCSACNGTGTVRLQQRTMFGVIQTQKACDTCRGTGRIIEQKCQKCCGAGRVKVPRKRKVDLPAGIDEGQTYTVRGEGSAGVNNGPSGDLYIDIAVRPHHFFERDGYDVHCEVPLTFAQAALGGEIDVMTLDGVQKVRVSAGTQPGDVHTLKGKGIQKLNGRGKGDQLIHFTLSVPKNLNEAQKRLIREMDDALPKQTAKKGFFNK